MSASSMHHIRLLWTRVGWTFFDLLNLSRSQCIWPPNLAISAATFVTFLTSMLALSRIFWQPVACSCSWHHLGTLRHLFCMGLWKALFELSWNFLVCSWSILTRSFVVRLNLSVASWLLSSDGCGTGRLGVLQPPSVLQLALQHLVFPTHSRLGRALT